MPIQKMRPTSVGMTPQKEDGQPLEWKYKAVATSSSGGDKEIVAAVTGKKIRVLSFAFVVSGATDLRFESSAGGAELTGVMSYAANSGIETHYNPIGHFETVAGQSLSLEQSAAVVTAGLLTYVEV